MPLFDSVNQSRFPHSTIEVGPESFTGMTYSPMCGKPLIICTSRPAIASSFTLSAS